jgi:hypothetical protein
MLLHAALRKDDASFWIQAYSEQTSQHLLSPSCKLQGILLYCNCVQIHNRKKEGSIWRCLILKLDPFS